MGQEKASKAKQKWDKDDKFAFTHSRLRAQTIPDKKKQQAREACRKKKEQW